MKAQIVTLDNKKSGEASLNKAIFGLEARKDILQRVVRWQLAKRQAGTHKTKSIGDISGTTAKPFKQKGTGHARQGSKRSPHMRGGAVIFGPVVRSHAHKLPKAIRKLGLKIALSSRLKLGKLKIIKDIKLDKPKTNQLSKNMAAFEAKSILMVDAETIDDKFAKAARNIKNFNVLPVAGLNVYDILRHEILLLTEEAVKKIEERLK